MNLPYILNFSIIVLGLSNQGTISALSGCAFCYSGTGDKSPLPTGLPYEAPRKRFKPEGGSGVYRYSAGIRGRFRVSSEPDGVNLGWGGGDY